MNEKNKSLRLFSRILIAIEFIIILFAIVFIILLLYSSFNTSAFPSIVVVDVFSPGFSSGRFNYCPNCVGSNYIFLTQISVAMKLWLLLRGCLLFGFTFLIIRMVRQVVQSVNSNKTFYEGNIRSFKKMAFYGFIISIVSSFNFFINDNVSNVDLGIPFIPILFSLFCLMLAEVFKQGKVLTDDKNSIV